MSVPEETSGLQSYELANYLVGPFEGAGEASSLREWEVPYYDIAIGALQRLAGQEELPADWMPGPAEGAELYRQLARERIDRNIISSVGAYVDSYKNGTADTIMRSDQKEIFEHTFAGLAQAPKTLRDVVVKAPTGIGKTVIITSLVDAIQRGQRPNEPVRSLVLVPTKDILAQTMSAFEKFAPSSKPGVYFGEEKSLAQTTIMTYQSFSKAFKAGIISRDMFNILIKDEEHRSKGRVRAEDIDAFTGKEGEPGRMLVAGFSATPRAEVLAYRGNLLDAISSKLLSAISIRSHPTHASIEEQERFRRFDDYDPEELEALIDNAPRNAIIVDEVLSGLKSGRRVMVRCLPGGELLHPQLLNDRLKNMKVPIRDPYTGAMSIRGIRSVVVSGTMPMNQRKLIRSIFNDPFRDGSEGIDVLMFVDTLVEGFDSEIAKKLINGCPSRSARVVEQLLGRTTRRFQRMDGSFQSAQVVDLVDDAMDGQVLFSDVINSYAPAGKRYVPGALIGPGLRDMRRNDRFVSAFEDAPVAEPQPEPIPEPVASGSQEAAIPAPRPKSDSKPAKSTGNRASGASNADWSELRQVADTRQLNPFDGATIVDASNIGGYTSLQSAAKQLEMDSEELEDIIMERRLQLATNTEASSYYLPPASLARLKAYVDRMGY